MFVLFCLSAGGSPFSAPSSFSLRSTFISTTMNRLINFIDIYFQVIKRVWSYSYIYHTFILSWCNKAAGKALLAQENRIWYRTQGHPLCPPLFCKALWVIGGQLARETPTSCDIGQFYKSKSTSSSKPLMPCRPCPVDHNSPWYLSINRPTGPTRI